MRLVLLDFLRSDGSCDLVVLIYFLSEGSTIVRINANQNDITKWATWRSCMSGWLVKILIEIDKPDATLQK